MLYTGIDLHRRLIVMCTVNDSGAIVARSRMKTESDAVTAYFRQWTDPHRAVVECTSNWYWLSDLLHSLGVTVVLAHAKYLKAIAYAKVKTDAVDAHTLAQLLRMGFVPEAHQLPSEYRLFAISFDNGWSWNTTGPISWYASPACSPNLTSPSSPV